MRMNLVLEGDEIATMLICLNQNIEDLESFKVPAEITDPTAIAETKENAANLLSATKALRDKFLRTPTDG